MGFCLFPMLALITRLFPLWALLLSTLALLQPGLFTPGSRYIVPLLTCIMFCMGMTLTWEDFRAVGKRPWPVLLALLLQYSIMPLAAWGISLLLHLSPELMVGMVLVGATSGGTASNVIAYLAKGNVALSITCTLASTLCATLMLPGLSWLYLHRMVAVDVFSMMQSVAMIVLIPVVFGTGLNTLAGKHLKRVQPLLPLFSVIAIVVIIAIIVAVNAAKIQSMGPLLALAIVLHNGTGLFFGYTIPRLLKQDTVTCRTLAIEVGMQNSGLAVALALKHFSAAAALPGALFSVWHNISGSVAAAFWSKQSND